MNREQMAGKILIWGSDNAFLINYEEACDLADRLAEDKPEDKHYPEEWTNSKGEKQLTCVCGKVGCPMKETHKQQVEAYADDKPTVKYVDDEYICPDDCFYCDPTHKAKCEKAGGKDKPQMMVCPQLTGRTIIQSGHAVPHEKDKDCNLEPKCIPVESAKEKLVCQECGDVNCKDGKGIEEVAELTFVPNSYESKKTAEIIEVLNKCVREVNLMKKGGG